MARDYYLTTNAADVLLNPDALLATPLSVFSQTFRYDENGVVTADAVTIQFKNIDTVTVLPGNSSNDSLTGTTSADIIFWDLASLSGINVSVFSLLSGAGLPSDSQDAIIERFDLDGGDDVLNLTYAASSGLGAYTASATVFGGEGDDVVWSGAGNDSIWGDNGNDMLYGGEGDDTLYGGAGGDSLSGGSGNDHIYAGAVVSLDGGAGSDFIQLDGSGSAYVLPVLLAGADDASDGADTVLTTGAYGAITSYLGAAADVFIGSTASAGAPDSDLVFGGSGGDAIASNDGSDTLFGGANGDVLWGGAGADTIYGGDGNDAIYVGSGNGDIAYGGPGEDAWYLYRGDNAGNQIYDLAREGNPIDDNTNALIVLGDAKFDEIGGDYIGDGTGLREIDHDIMDNAGGDDMVQVHLVSGTLYQLDVIGGTGTLGMNVQFDARDINYIVLWDNDAVLGQVQQLYTWNGSDYEFTA